MYEPVYCVANASYRLHSLIPLIDQYFCDCKHLYTQKHPCTHFGKLKIFVFVFLKHFVVAAALSFRSKKRWVARRSARGSEAKREVTSNWVSHRLYQYRTQCFKPKEEEEEKYIE